MMLSRSGSLALLALASAVAVAGCTTNGTDTDTPIETSSNGAGGDDGGGGFGGTDLTGSGGQGGETTGEGGSTGTGEGGGLADTCGVDATCWADEDTGCAPSACEAAEINFACPSTSEDTLAYQTCNLTAEIYRENVWGHVLDCMREAGADIVAQCDEAEATVGACIEEGYENACVNDAADTLCDQAATACADFDDDTFPVEQCKADLVVMNEAGLGTYTDCFNDDSVEGTCAEIHDICFVQLTSLDL
jgi:hypothetical protein